MYQWLVERGWELFYSAMYSLMLHSRFWIWMCMFIIFMLIILNCWDKISKSERISLRNIDVVVGEGVFLHQVLAGDWGSSLLRCLPMSVVTILAWSRNIMEMSVCIQDSEVMADSDQISINDDDIRMTFNLIICTYRLFPALPFFFHRYSWMNASSSHS